TVGYVANKATHVFAGNGPAYDLNPVPYGPGASMVTGKDNAGNTVPNGTSCATLALAGGSCSASFSATTTTELRRPFYNHFTYPGFLDPMTGLPTTCCSDGIMGNYFGNDANAHHNSLQIPFDKRFSQGLQFMSSYTFSHARNQSVDDGSLYAVDKPQSTGPDDFNRNHVFIWNGVYQLPFGKGKRFAGGVNRAMNLVVGGWSLSDTVIWSSGLPWTPTSGSCGSISDTGPCRPDFHGSFDVGAGDFDKVNHKVTYFTPVAPLSYDFSSATVGVTDS